MIDPAEVLCSGTTSRLLEIVEDGVIVFDSEGIYRAWSPAMVRISGIPESCRLGRSIDSFPSALADMDSRELVRQLLSGETIEMPSARISYAGGREAWVSLRGVPVRSADRVIGAMIVVTDLTERRKAEETLRRHREQLEHAMKMEAVGRLAGGVAHDFNNLLSVILSFAHFAQESAGEGAQDDLREVVAAAERAAALTRQLLLFSRRDPADAQVVALSTVVTGLQKLLCRILGEDIRLSVKSSVDLWRTKVDPGRIEQVLANLAVNARDAMPGGGRLEISTSNTILPAGFDGKPAVAPGRYTRLSVEDTGTGIPLEIQNRIFEPFFTTKPAGKGTGLGLSTVYAIVAEAGGCIQLQSVPGRTVFNLFFPATEEQPARETVKETTVSPPAGTVLIAEDEPGVRAATARMFTRNGWRVIEAADGVDAVERGLQRIAEIDVLVTDVVMPGLSGAEVATRLRAARPDLRVVLMSGYPGDALNDRGVPPDMPLLRKPINEAAMMEAVVRARRRPTLGEVAAK